MRLKSWHRFLCKWAEAWEEWWCTERVRCVVFNGVGHMHHTCIYRHYLTHQRCITHHKQTHKNKPHPSSSSRGNSFIPRTCCSIRQLVNQVPFSFPLFVVSSSVNNPDITTVHVLLPGQLLPGQCLGGICWCLPTLPVFASYSDHKPNTCVAAWETLFSPRHLLQHSGPHIVLASVQHHSPCALLRGQPNYYNTTSYSIQDHTSFLPLYHFTHHVCCCVGSRFAMAPPVTTFRATHRSCLCTTSFTTCVAAWAADLLQRHQLQHPGPHIVLASI